MAQIGRLRLVVANDPRSYREAIATAIQRLQPDVEVTVLDPADLADQVERWRPHMVISSVPVARAGGWPLCWVALYPAPKTQAVVNVAAQHTWAHDIDLAELLAVLYCTAALGGQWGSTAFEDGEGQMSERMNATPSPLRRLGIVMEPDLADAREAAGVLNPAVARGPDGQLYLLPRLVAPGNYSRIGLARVRCDPCGTPTGLEQQQPLSFGRYGVVQVDSYLLLAGTGAHGVTAPGITKV